MNDHQKFCESLGNESYTRLQYDDTDREIREALRKGMRVYKKTADKRANEAKRMRAVALAQQNSDLGKFRKMHKDCLKNRGDSWNIDR